VVLVLTGLCQPKFKCQSQGLPGFCNCGASARDQGRTVWVNAVRVPVACCFLHLVANESRLCCGVVALEVQRVSPHSSRLFCHMCEACRVTRLGRSSGSLFLGGMCCARKEQSSNCSRSNSSSVGLVTLGLGFTRLTSLCCRAVGHSTQMHKQRLMGRIRYRGGLLYTISLTGVVQRM
jgi:hypothetical protein